MKLKSWAESERGRSMALAKAIDVPPSFVSKMLSGEKSIPAEHCKAIEKLTGGLVTCQEMRPNDWQKYWPESAPALANTAQPATEIVAQPVIETMAPPIDPIQGADTGMRIGGQRRQGGRYEKLPFTRGV